jgi:hypothetical protein
MKKRILIIGGFLTMSVQGFFAQLSDGTYAYANNEITVNFTLVDDGWTISTVTMTNNVTKKTAKGTGEYRNAEDMEWYEFQTADCNFSFDLPTNTIIIEQYDCSNGGKEKKYTLTKK